MMAEYVSNILANFDITFFPSKIPNFTSWCKMLEKNQFWKMRFIVGWPWKFEIIGILCHGYSWNFLNRFKISMRSFWAKIQEKMSKLDFWQLKWKLFIYDGNSRNLMVLKSYNFLWLIAKWELFLAFEHFLTITRSVDVTFWAFWDKNSSICSNFKTYEM